MLIVALQNMIHEWTFWRKKSDSYFKSFAV